MKIVFNFLVVALAVAAGWYFQPGLVKSLEARRARAVAQHSAEIAAAVRQATGGSASIAAAEPPAASSAAQQLAASLRRPSAEGGPKALPGSPARPSLPGDPAPTAGAAPGTAGDDIEARYPLPTFKTISEITKEWSSIPSRAFPRTVKTLVAVNLEGPSGKVPLPEKSEALAVGMTQGMLVLMKSREDPARSLVPLANTDLKETLTVLFEKYKKYKTDQVLGQRERARSLKARANGASEAEMAAAGPKPSREASGGVIPAMLQSLRDKQIKETTEDRIIAWGDLNVEQINGGTFWTGTIQCTVDNAIFGPTPTELMALIRDDKVVKWLYSGSKEEVQ